MADPECQSKEKSAWLPRGIRANFGRTLLPIRAVRRYSLPDSTATRASPQRPDSPPDPRYFVSGTLGAAGSAGALGAAG